METNKYNNLTPILWEAPTKAFHLKSCNATHYLYGVNFEAFKVLPKNQQKRAIFCCKKCGGEVAWADSKSGKKFLCDVTKSTNRFGRRGKLTFTEWYYNPQLWHSKSCKPLSDGSVHPTAIAHEERTARALKERAERQ